MEEMFFQFPLIEIKNLYIHIDNFRNFHKVLCIVGMGTFFKILVYQCLKNAEESLRPKHCEDNNHNKKNSPTPK